MNNTVGRNVRLFLVDGNPNGLITAEIINWSGHILSGSRLEITDFLKRDELKRTGVYFLFGYDPEENDQAKIYIGESDNVQKRLAQHNQDEKKSFWEKTCVVTSKDQNLTKAHVRYLEARLIEIATDVGRAKLVNGTAQDPPPLPESDISDMEYFIGQIRLILPILGFDAFKATPKRDSSHEGKTPEEIDPSHSPIFEIDSKKKGLKAEGQEIGGEFVVFKDSLASAKWIQKGDSNAGYAKLHKRLMQEGTLSDDNNTGIAKFNKDIAFSSPSAASAIIYGRADNGRTSWKVKGKNKTYAEWQEQKVEEIIFEELDLY